MKTIKYSQSRFIDGSDGHETAAEFNEAMIELAGLNPKWEREGNSFWIFYTVEYEEPENLKDIYELKGVKACCIDCPYIVRDLNRFGTVDGRKKSAVCGKTGARTNVENRACEIYYRDLERRKDGES